MKMKIVLALIVTSSVFFVGAMGVKNVQLKEEIRVLQSILDTPIAPPKSTPLVYKWKIK